MTRNMYTIREHGMGHVLFCVPPSFVVMHSFMCYYIEQKPIEQNNEELTVRMKHSGVYVFIVLQFLFFQDYAIKAGIDLELLFGGP